MCLVLQKIITRSKPWVRMRRRVVSALDMGVVVMEYWSMSGRSSSLGSTVISTSSRWYIQLTVITSWEMVAENRPRFFRFFTFSTIRVTSLKKPMSSIRSASSRMMVCTLSKRMFFRL